MNQHTRIMCAVIAALLLFANQSPVLAQRSTFDGAWTEGLDAFNTGDFEEAFKKFSTARRLAPDKPGPYRYLARISRQLKRWQICVTNATTAVKLNPSSRHAGQVRQDLEVCRTSLGRLPMDQPIPAGQGALSVTSNVGGATVEVDGIAKGGTPLKPFPVTPGKHVVTLKHAGHLVTEVAVEAVVTVVVDVDVAMKVDPHASRARVPDGIVDEIKTGWLMLSSSASGPVTYVLGGKVVTPKADGTIEAEPGTYVLEATLDGYEPWRRRVIVARGQKRNVNVSLRSESSVNGDRRLAHITFGVAAAAGAVGITFGLMENSQFDEAHRLAAIERERPAGVTVGAGVPESTITTRQELDDLHSKGNTFGLVSNISYGVALAALGVSVYYFTKARKPRSAKELPLAIVPTLSPRGDAGVALVGELDF